MSAQFALVYVAGFDFSGTNDMSPDERNFMVQYMMDTKAKEAEAREKAIQEAKAKQKNGK